jgi:hypothetical protein
VDVTGSGWCRITGSVITAVKTLGSATVRLVSQRINAFLLIQYY